MYIPRRVVIAVAAWLALYAAYILRVVTSVPMDTMAALENWDPTTKGLVLSAFYWGYIFLQLPGAWLASRYGPKLVIGVGLMVALATVAVLPFVVDYLYAVIGLRILCGLGEAASFPSTFHLIAQWYPKHERATASAAIPTGSYLGIIYGMGANTAILAMGWEGIFYISAMIAAACLIPWLIFVSDSPTSDGFALMKPSQSEKDYIAEVKASEKDLLLSNEPGDKPDNLLTSYGTSGSTALINEKPSEPKVGFPIGALLTSSALWAIAINHFANNWTLYVFISWLPHYMSQALDFDLTSHGSLLMVPYAINPFLASIAGFAADRLVKGNYIRQITARKLFQCTALIGGGAIFLVIAYVPLSHLQATILLFSAISIMSLTAAGYQGNHVDLSPKYASLMWGITNTFATIPGIVGVYITGYILQVTNNNWSYVFLVAACVNGFATVVYLIFAQGEQIDFDRKRTC